MTHLQSLSTCSPVNLHHIMLTFFLLMTYLQRLPVSLRACLSVYMSILHYACRLSNCLSYLQSLSICPFLSICLSVYHLIMLSDPYHPIPSRPVPSRPVPSIVFSIKKSIRPTITPCTVRQLAMFTLSSNYNYARFCTDGRSACVCVFSPLFLCVC